MAIPRVLCRVRLLLNNEFSVVSKYATLVNSVQINHCVFQRTIKQCHINFSTSVVLARAISLKDHHEQKNQLSSSSSSSSSSDSDTSDDEEEA